MSKIRIGAPCWNQYAEWRQLLEAGVRGDRSGDDRHWTRDR
jgi:hypothetical protein